MSDRKARPRLTELSGTARQAPSGVAFSLVTLLLATQEKVTRAPQECESSCFKTQRAARSPEPHCDKSIA